MDYDFNLSKLERVMSGADKVAALGHELERRGLKRTIVVTGKTLGGSALLKVTGAAGARCVAVFKGARQHVPRSSVHELQARLVNMQRVRILGGLDGNIRYPLVYVELNHLRCGTPAAQLVGPDIPQNCE